MPAAGNPARRAARLAPDARPARTGRPHPLVEGGQDASSAGGVRKVTQIQTSVVAPIVTSKESVALTAWPILPAMKNPIATTNEASIALTSLQALMRHQNQRSR